MSRLLEREELDALARPPREQMRRALDESPEAAREALARLDRGYANFVAGFRTWLATIQAFLAERFGYEALDAALGDERAVAAALRWGLRPDDVERDADARTVPVEAHIARGDADAALRAFEDLQSHHLRWHDTWRDRLTSWLSSVYRRHGIDVLEASLRYSGERTLLAWMPRDVARPPEQRIRQWAGMMLGNFSQIHIDEDDEKFTITQKVCGTCSRQVRDGCYGPAPLLALVDEAHPLTFGEGGGVPVYRTHVAVMHYLMPIERTGVPWPVIECPPGVGSGACRLLLYKDPAQTPAEHARRVTM